MSGQSTCIQPIYNCIANLTGGICNKNAYSNLGDEKISQLGRSLLIYLGLFTTAAIVLKLTLNISLLSWFIYIPITILTQKIIPLVVMAFALSAVAVSLKNGSLCNGKEGDTPPHS